MHYEVEPRVYCSGTTGHSTPTLFPNDFFRLWLAADGDNFHHQVVSPLPDQRHHLLVPYFYYIHTIHLRHKQTLVSTNTAQPAENRQQ